MIKIITKIVYSIKVLVENLLKYIKNRTQTYFANGRVALRALHRIMGSVALPTNLF